MIRELKLVIVKGGKYVAERNEYAQFSYTDNPKKAHSYFTDTVFFHASLCDGKVYILFPSGKLIETSKEDFRPL